MSDDRLPQVGDIVRVQRLWGWENGTVVSAVPGIGVTVRIPLRGAWGDRDDFDMITVRPERLQRVAEEQVNSGVTS